MKFFFWWYVTLVVCLRRVVLAQEIISRCLGDIEFSLVAERVNLETAFKTCKDRVVGSRLARIDRSVEQDFVIELVKDVEPQTNIWIGVFEFDPNTGSSDLSVRFDYADRVPEGEEFFSRPNQYPWSSIEPDDSGGNERCVEIKRDDNHSWHDVECGTPQHYLCRRACPPTPSPTESPTNNPTSSPSTSPSASPTKGPTFSPSFFPTGAPTNTTALIEDPPTITTVTFLLVLLVLLGLLGGAITVIRRERKGIDHVKLRIAEVSTFLQRNVGDIELPQLPASPSCPPKITTKGL